MCNFETYWSIRLFTELGGTKFHQNSRTVTSVEHSSNVALRWACLPVAGTSENFVTNHVDMEDNAVSSVHLFLSTLIFEPDDLWPCSFACIWIMTVAHHRSWSEVKTQLVQPWERAVLVVKNCEVLPARAHRVALFSVSLALSQTPAYAMRPWIRG